jgi:hypothetical protein
MEIMYLRNGVNSIVAPKRKIEKAHFEAFTLLRNRADWLSVTGLQ